MRLAMYLRALVITRRSPPRSGVRRSECWWPTRTSARRLQLSAGRAPTGGRDRDCGIWRGRVGSAPTVCRCDGLPRRSFARASRPGRGRACRSRAVRSAPGPIWISSPDNRGACLSGTPPRSLTDAPVPARCLRRVSCRKAKAPKEHTAKSAERPERLRAQQVFNPRNLVAVRSIAIDQKAS